MSIASILPIVCWRTLRIIVPDNVESPNPCITWQTSSCYFFPLGTSLPASLDSACQHSLLSLGLLLEKPLGFLFPSDAGAYVFWWPPKAWALWEALEDMTDEASHLTWVHPLPFAYPWTQMRLQIYMNKMIWKWLPPPPRPACCLARYILKIFAGSWLEIHQMICWCSL
jgi:hypothetical protein